MSINLLDMVKSHVSSSLVDKAAGLLGESPEAVSKGLLGSSGALLSGLASKLSNKDTAGQIFDNLGSGNVLNSLGQQLAGGNETVKFLSNGLESAKGLLGDNTDSVLGAISSASGLRAESASSLLGMAAPMVTGILGKQKAEGMNLSDMTDMVSSQAGSFSNLLPSGMDLSSLGSLGKLGGLAATVGGLVGGVGDAVGSIADKGAGLAGGALDAAGNAIGSVADGVGDLGHAAADAAGNVVSGAADLAGSAAGAVGDAAGAVGDAAGAALGKAGDLAGGAAGAVGDAAGAVGDAAGAALGKAGDLAGGAVDGVGNLASASAGGLGKIIPWVLAGLAALFAAFFFRSCSQGDSMTDAMKDAANSTTGMVKDAGDAVKDTAGAAVDATGDAAKATMDAAGNAVDATADMAGKAVDAAGDVAGAAVDVAGDAAGAAGDMMEAGADKLAAKGKKIGDKFRFSLPGGVDVDVPDGSFEATMLRNFAEGKADYGKAYVLDRIYFATGSYNLTDESADQLKTMAAILKAYPELTANLRGHTDSTGNADKNLALSLSRANAVKAYLRGLNVDASRVTTVGKGSAEPIADNGSTEGRAKNRRIDISFTK